MVMAADNNTTVFLLSSLIILAEQLCPCPFNNWIDSPAFILKTCIQCLLLSSLSVKCFCVVFNVGSKKWGTDIKRCYAFFNVVKVLIKYCLDIETFTEKEFRFAWIIQRVIDNFFDGGIDDALNNRLSLISASNLNSP